MDASLEQRLKTEMERDESDAPMTRAVTALLQHANTAGVSDVHLNPDAKGMVILYRMDGVLLAKARIDAARSDQFLRKVKVLSSLLTYKTDTAQDQEVSGLEKEGSRRGTRGGIRIRAASPSSSGEPNGRYQETSE